VAPRDSKTLACSYDDLDRNSLVWNTTKALADILAPRTAAAISAGIKAIEDGTIDLSHVDCYLPVHRPPDASMVSGCSDCRFQKGTLTASRDPRSRRKMSILRLWAGTQTRGFIHVMRRFFFEVLLPTGLASRYNEPFNCTGHTVIDWMLKLEYTTSSFSDSRDSAALSPDLAVTLVAYFPPQVRLRVTNEVTAAEWREEPDEWPYTNRLRFVAHPNVAFVKRQLKANAQQQERLDAIALPILQDLRTYLRCPALEYVLVMLCVV
jgi:hypothetical protein